MHLIDDEWYVAAEEHRKRFWPKLVAPPLAFVLTLELTHVCGVVMKKETCFAPLERCHTTAPHTEVNDFSSARTRPLITSVSANTITATAAITLDSSFSIGNEFYRVFTPTGGTSTNL